MFLHRIGKTRAPEFPAGLEWINSDPLSLRALAGKVILLDFWTYSCINCIRTFPHLKRWHEMYKEKGVVVIGIHTPEFDFEKSRENVETAIKEFGITYPVVLDSDYKVWNTYANRWWPRKFVVDTHGSIVYDHIGEGGYAETEQAIQKALVQNGVNGLPAVKPDVSIGGGICYRTTPETYLGFLRGRIVNGGDAEPNAESVFTDVPEHEEDSVYLHGHWTMGGESLRHTRKLPTATEYLLLRYSAFSVNLVMGTIASARGQSSEIEVELDGQPLPEDMAGEDVTYRKGKAIVVVKNARMYRLVDSDTYHRGTLKIKTSSASLEMFAFTFGGCKGA